MHSPSCIKGLYDNISIEVVVMAMGKSTLTSIFVLTILLYSVGAARIDNPDSAKLEILKRNSKAAANAVRKIVIRSPYDQVQLASMANDFAFDLNLAAYPLNNVGPARSFSSGPGVPTSLSKSTQRDEMNFSSGNPTFWVHAHGTLTPKLKTTNENADIEETEFDVTIKNIANKLRLLSNETSIVAEKLIMDILFEAQLGNINRYSTIVTNAGEVREKQSIPATDQATDSPTRAQTEATSISYL